MNHALKKVVSGAAAVAMAATMAVPAFAATVPENPVTKAEIDVSKIVETDVATKFPLADSYSFVLEPSSVLMGRGSGTQYTKETMPVPAGTEVNNSTTITIDGFGTKTGTDTDTARSHTSAFADITFDNTGIYTYKLTESIPVTKEAGVTYDESVYYVNVYVTNVMNDTGNTPAVDEDGNLLVTVSDITLYKGSNGNIALQADDFGGVAAAETDTDTKVDITTTPKEGEADTMAITAPFKNVYDVEDVVLSKTVTGTLGDPNKEFTFTFTPGDNKTTGYSYAYKVFNMAGTAPAADDAEVTDKAGSFTAENSTVDLKHKQYAVIAGVPVGLKYAFTETTVTGYTTTINQQNGATKDVAVTESNATGDRVVASSNNDDVAGTTTKNEQDYINNMESTTPTGVMLRVLPFVMLAGLLFAGIAMVTTANRKRRDNYQGL